MRTLFTISFLFFLSLSLLSQESESYKYSIEGQAKYGFLIGHHPEVQRLSTQQFPSFSLYVAHKTTGLREWHQKYLNPEVGLGFYYSPLTNSNEIGDAYAVFGFTNLSLGKNSWQNLRMRFGFGPGYITRKFDPVDNNQNVAIGTHLNIFILVELHQDIHIAKNTDLSLGVGITHFSNTGFTMPNLGYNLASVQLGLKYELGHQELNKTPIVSRDSSKWNNEVVFAYGRRQSQLAKVHSNIYNLRYQGIYSLSFKSKLIASADIFVDVADYSSDDFKKVDDFFQAGVAVGYLLNFEQFQLMLQYGWYLYNNNPDYQPYYHRLGINWIVTDHFLVNMSLRSEYARARNLELGLGWRF